MNFQTDIQKDSPVIKILEKRVKEIKDIIDYPFKILNIASTVIYRVPDRMNFNEFMKTRDKLIIELNELEKSIDLITKNTYENVNDIEVVDEAHVRAEPYGMPNPSTHGTTD